MKLSLIAAIVALLIFADACTRGGPPDEPVPLSAATCASFMKGKTEMNLKQVLTCAALICATYPTACQPQPPKPPTPDAGTGGVAPFATGGSGPGTGGGSAVTPEQQACANELALGCPEGTRPTCAADMALRCSNPKVACNTQCIIAAKSKTELQTKCFVACGGM